MTAGVAALGARARGRAILLPAAILLTAVAVWIAFLAFTGIRLEDALITWRYAGNIAEGRGFVFNEGERVLGTTTPLLTLALGSLGSIFGAASIPILTSIMMMASAAGAGLFTRAALLRCGFSEPIAIFAMATYLFHPDTLWTSTGGMETPLVVFCMAGGLWALASERFTLAGAAAALLVLTRIDGALWAAGIFAFILARRPREAWRPAAVAAALLVPWLLFAFLYFGSPIPHSIIAKRAIGAAVQPFGAELTWAFAGWCAPFLATSTGAGTLIGIALFVAGVFALRRRGGASPLWLAACFPPLFFAALYIGRSPLYFDWYLVPAGWAALVVGCAGAGSIAEKIIATTGRRTLSRAEAPVETGQSDAARLEPSPLSSIAHLTAAARVEQAPPSSIDYRSTAGRSEKTPRSSIAHPSAAAAAAVIAVLLLAHFAILAYRGLTVARLHRDYQTNETGARRRIGEWLAENTPVGSSVAMEAIGYQASYSRRRVIDLAGLVSPEVVRLTQESRSNAEAFRRILDELSPDYLVLRSFEVDANRHFHGGPLFETPRQAIAFFSRYEEATRFTAPIPDLWGDTARLTIFKRRVPPFPSIGGQ